MPLYLISSITIFLGLITGVLIFSWYENQNQPRSEQLFVYGTLTSPWVRLYACRCLPPATAITVPGYRVEARNLLPDPAATTIGYILDVTPTELARLDRFERTPDHYVRVRVPFIADEPWVYLRTHTASTTLGQ